MTDQKKPTKRGKIKNASLIKKYNPRVRHDLIDYDYLEKLSEEELSWLNKFTNEYVNASVSADDHNLLHDYELHRKDIFDANNKRNVDLYGRAKYGVKDKQTGVTHKLEDYHSSISKIDEASARDVESAYLDYIEYQQVLIMIEEFNKFMSEFSEPE